MSLSPAAQRVLACRRFDVASIATPPPLEAPWSCVIFFKSHPQFSWSSVLPVTSDHGSAVLVGGGGGVVQAACMSSTGIEKALQ